MNAPDATAERVARACLSALVEPGTGSAIVAAVRRRGPVVVLDGLRSGDRSLDPEARIERRAETVDGADLLRRADEAGTRFLCPGDPEWPTGLETLDLAQDAGLKAAGPPPIGLWVRGEPDLAAATGRSVAVVGARAATEYGVRVAADLAADLATAGWTVVSGAAYGIDAAAHRGALAVGGTTVAVLACGVDVVYPRGHTALLHRVAGEGLIVSELPPGSTPTRSRFLARNRLIAAMTGGTVVVEAALRSGALNTAGWASEQGRAVLAVPGPVTSAMSAGCHDVVRRGAATLVTDAAEIADMVGELGSDAVAERRGPPRLWDDLAPVTRDVLEAMPARGAATVDELCRSTGLAAGPCIAALGELTLAGLVDVAEQGWRLSPRRRGA